MCGDAVRDSFFTSLYVQPALQLIPSTFYNHSLSFYDPCVVDIFLPLIILLSSCTPLYFRHIIVFLILFSYVIYTIYIVLKSIKNNTVVSNFASDILTVVFLLCFSFSVKLKQHNIYYYTRHKWREGNCVFTFYCRPRAVFFRSASTQTRCNTMFYVPVLRLSTRKFVDRHGMQSNERNMHLSLKMYVICTN